MCCWFFPGRCYFSTSTAGRWQEHSSSRPRSSDCLVVFQLLSVSKKTPKKGQIVKQNCILCLFLNSFYWPWLKTMWDQGKIWRIHKDSGKENCSAKRKQLHFSGLQAILGSHYFFLSRTVQYTPEERKHWRTWRIRPALIMAAVWILPGLLTQLGTFLGKKTPEFDRHPGLFESLKTSVCVGSNSEVWNQDSNQHVTAQSAFF